MGGNVIDDSDADVRLYVALLVYESSCAAPDHEALYEETVTLVAAHSAEEAADKAHEYGKRNEVVYKNERGESLSVKLKHVVDVNEAPDLLGDGAEIYTRHFRDYESYRKFEVMLSGESL